MLNSTIFNNGVKTQDIIFLFVITGHAQGRLI